MEFKLFNNFYSDWSFQSINVIECPEFRNLLLHLRDDISDNDIFGRDKLKRSIMEAWYAYYPVLKAELQVFNFLYSMFNNSTANNMTVRFRENFLYR